METRQATPIDETPICGIDGKEDLYGLGIRLGVYLQTLTLVISGLLRQSDTAQLLNLGALYQFALLFGVIYSTVHDEEFYAVEAIIMAVFGIASMGMNHTHFTAMAKRVSRRDSSEKLHWTERVFSPYRGVILRYSVLVAIDGYQVWLWFVGLDRLLHTSCTRTSFFFARVDIFGPFRTFAKFFSIFILCTATLSLCVLIKHAVSWKRHRKDASSEGGIFVEAGQAPWLPWLLFPSLIVLFILSILAIELTIRWNNIQGVYELTSVGQIIPFIISAGGFVAVLLKGREEIKELPIDGEQMED
ncbi:hypothetical protein OQA88_4824 [Cercophora sp. LCS_1]